LPSLTKDVIVIRRIAILAPDVIYEKGETQTNFDAIVKNIGNAVGSDQKSKSKRDQEAGKKLIVELFTLRDAQGSGQRRLHCKARL